MLRPNLKTFLTVCETGSFNRAANLLYVTPSAVLQQIQTLEAELNMKLFVRHKKGVTLTPEGRYLLEKGSVMLQLNEEIHRDIQMVGSKDRTIYIGTSIMEKCRLLYELWVLFSAENMNCEIQMLNIDAWHRIPERTDLIESVNSNIEWEKEWEFYEIHQVPFGFAVANTHPLSQKKLITVNDLQNYTVMTLNEGSCEAIAGVLACLKDAGISVVRHNGPEVNPLWESGFRREVLLIPICWQDVLINTVTIPFEKEFLLPYGIFYRPNIGGAAKNFLDYIIQTYESGNSRGIVPVLG